MPVWAGILIRDLMILLAKRSANRTFYPNVCDLPGGYIEVGESPKTALVREFEEELGIVATALESLGTFDELRPEKYWHANTTFFRVVPLAGPF